MVPVTAHLNPNYILKIIIYLGSVLILLFHIRLDFLNWSFPLIYIYIYIYISPMPTHVLVDFVVFPPGHGRSVTDF